MEKLNTRFVIQNDKWEITWHADKSSFYVHDKLSGESYHINADFLVNIVITMNKNNYLWDEKGWKDLIRAIEFRRRVEGDGDQT